MGYCIQRWIPAIITMLSLNQNSSDSLELLRASSYFYNEAKRLLTFQFSLTVIGALVSAIFVALFPDYKIWAVLYSISVALLDSLILDRWQSRYKSKGAKAQELFDGGLFGLSWRKWQVGPKLPHEEVLSASKSYNGSVAHLRDWYPQGIDELPRQHQALICQRINVWWDAELRRKVGYCIIVVLSAVALAVVILGVATRQSTDKLILTIVAPLFPAVIWGTRECLRQFDAATRLDGVRTLVTETWNSVVNSSDYEPSAHINDIQAAIFDGRSRNPLIFNWIHRLFRPEGQETMQQMATRLVVEYNKNRLDSK